MRDAEWMIRSWHTLSGQPEHKRLPDNLSHSSTQRLLSGPLPGYAMFRSGQSKLSLFSRFAIIGASYADLTLAGADDFSS